MSNIIQFKPKNNHVIEKETDELIMVESLSLGDTTLIANRVKNKDIFTIVIFNLTERPNELSRNSPMTSWGYPTLAIEFADESTFIDVKDMYIEDIIKGNLWWHNE